MRFCAPRRPRGDSTINSLDLGKGGLPKRAPNRPVDSEIDFFAQLDEEGLVEKRKAPDRASSLKWGRGFLFLKFQTLHTGSLVDHGGGHFLGFKSQGPAAAGKLFVPGDEKMLALKTIDFGRLHFT